MTKMFNKIAIIGVGLIGGSMGMAIRNKRLAREVIGIGRRQVSINKALKRGAIDKGTLDIKSGVKNADLIIVATPVDRVMEKLKEAARFAQKNAIIIDVNSTKEDVVRFADAAVPKSLKFIGTHPIAGSEQAGVSFASKDIFMNTVCIITPTRKTDKSALLKIKALWRALGARVETLSPKEHDRVVAGISHMPHVVSFSLAASVSPGDLKFSGSGFRDTTRIAKSDPVMWAEIFMQNKESVLKAIAEFERNLSVIKGLIRQGKMTPLVKKLDAARIKRETIG